MGSTTTYDVTFSCLDCWLKNTHEEQHPVSIHSTSQSLYLIWYRLLFCYKLLFVNWDILVDCVNNHHQLGIVLIFMVLRVLVQGVLSVPSIRIALASYIFLSIVLLEL